LVPRLPLPVPTRFTYLWFCTTRFCAAVTRRSPLPHTVTHTRFCWFLLFLPLHTRFGFTAPPLRRIPVAAFTGSFGYWFALEPTYITRNTRAGLVAVTVCTHGCCWFSSCGSVRPRTQDGYGSGCCLRISRYLPAACYGFTSGWTLLHTVRGYLYPFVFTHCPPAAHTTAFTTDYDVWLEPVLTAVRYTPVLADAVCAHHTHPYRGSFRDATVWLLFYRFTVWF